MASLKDARGLAADLHDLAGRLKSEVDRGSADFTKLVKIADEIGESADHVATTFEAINRSLTSLFEEEAPSDGAGADAAPEEGGQGAAGATAAAESGSGRAKDGDGARGQKRGRSKNR